MHRLAEDHLRDSSHLREIALIMKDELSRSEVKWRVLTIHPFLPSSAFTPPAWHRYRKSL
jgi:hypothetical protein